MHCVRVVLAFIGAALCYATVAPVDAAGGTREYEDKARGFTIRVPETLKQTPPKPSGSAKWLAGEFYDDQAKYKSSGAVNPEMNIGWFSTAKAASTPGGGTKKLDPEGPPTRDEIEEMFELKSIDDYLDNLIDNNTNLFGSNIPKIVERWNAAKPGKTNKQKLDFKYLEINGAKSKSKDDTASWTLWVAKLPLERPTESVTVTFHATFAREFAKDLCPAFLAMVKSFETQGSSGRVAREDVPTDPDQFREYIKKKKVIPGWKCMDSPKRQYVILYDESVKDDMAKDVGQRIEGIRAQVYEKVFPPDAPVTAVSVIRICKDREAYIAYGGSPSSAGYWQWMQQELVFFKDSSNPGDAFAVLYHEAFHQYIFYSVGACSPHSWFNEGHGDFFAGHVHKGGGRFELDEFKWRKDLAAQMKREKKTVPLKDWLGWSQGKYYGFQNGSDLDGSANYALGWNFIYFLRTTKKPEYQQFLPTYFDTLKGLVTKARQERKAARDKAKAAGGDPGEEEPEALANMSKEDEWCAAALEAALKTIDIDQLEKDWLAF
jgi:hypothetical protein